MNLKEYKLKTFDEKFQKEIRDTLGATFAAFGLKKTPKKLVNEVIYRAKFEIASFGRTDWARLSLEAQAFSGQKGYPKIDTYIQSVTSIYLDLASDKHEEFIEKCREFAEFSHGVKIRLSYAGITLHTRYSYKLKPKKTISTTNLSEIK
jgi:hypothetical protein